MAAPAVATAQAPGLLSLVRLAGRLLVPDMPASAVVNASIVTR